MSFSELFPQAGGDSPPGGWLLSDAIGGSRSASLARLAAGHRAGSCRHCGGSGMLRVNDQRYRTCLDCLGHGKAPQQAATDLLRLPLFSGVASASGAG